MINDYDLAAYLAGINPDSMEDEIEEAFYNAFGVDVDTFNMLAEQLIYLIDVGVSPLTRERYKGFSDGKGRWLAKVKVYRKPYDGFGS